jgi:hypothetical protein
MTALGRILPALKQPDMPKGTLFGVFAANACEAKQGKPANQGVSAASFYNRSFVTLGGMPVNHEL